MLGKKQFKEFLASPEKIATNILSARLSKLCQEGIIRRQASSYELTDKGRSLLPILGAIRDWGLRNLPGTQDHLSGLPAPELL